MPSFGAENIVHKPCEEEGEGFMFTLFLLSFEKLTNNTQIPPRTYLIFSHSIRAN
jgi:hypothetical protein